MIHVYFSQVARILKGKATRRFQYKKVFGSHEPNSSGYDHTDYRQGKENTKCSPHLRVVFCKRETNRTNNTKLKHCFTEGNQMNWVLYITIYYIVIGSA
jgi:hypothetical protein